MESEAQRRAKEKYEQKAYDKFLLRMRKDNHTKYLLSNYFASQSLSFNEGLLRAAEYCRINQINLRDRL